MSRPLPEPGPVERAILDDLSSTFRTRAADAPGGTLRILEGGEGSPLVLLHGRGSAATTWFPVLRDLARHHRVLAVDLPGFGASRGFRFTGGGFEEALAFFVAPIEAWLLSEGLSTPAIAGHSLGGFVTLELALRRRVSPAAIALIAAMGTGPDVVPAARLFFRAGPERLARLLGARLFEKLVPPSGPEGARRAALTYELYTVPEGRADAAAAFDALCPLTGPAPHRRPRLIEIDAPALVLWGERDEALPAPLALAAGAALRKSRVEILPAGHAPQADDPAKVVEIVRGFLAAKR